MHATFAPSGDVLYTSKDGSCLTSPAAAPISDTFCFTDMILTSDFGKGGSARSVSAYFYLKNAFSVQITQYSIH
jgi:hypothetical protein